MNKVLVKVDKNGTKHWEGDMVCPRCGGAGGSKNWEYTGWTCYQCGGTGTVWGKWVERTPEQEAKLAKQREKRLARRMAEIEAKQAEMAEAKRLADEAKKASDAEIMAQKTVSQYVGSAGDKVEMTVTYLGSPHWTSHMGWMTKTMYAHNFKDANGNKMVWMTEAFPDALVEDGKMVLLKGTVKDHREYNGEKQTLLTRCKIKEV